MLPLPAPVLNYLLKTTVADRAPAYLCASHEGLLTHWGGHLSEYDIVDLELGKPIGTQVCFLEGLLPLKGLELFLPQLSTGTGRSADVYLFAAETCDWVLLLATAANEEQRELQQYRNQVNLLQDAQNQLINRSFQSLPLSPTLLTSLPLDQCKNLTILVADLHGFIPFSEQHSPEVVFRVLNLYLRRLIQEVITEAGLVDRLLGNTVMSCFGVLPALVSAPTHAIKAGLKILAAVRQLNCLRASRQQPIFEVGIGIASGSAAIGLLGDRRHRVLRAIGYSVNLAATLQQQANPGEILIDESTFDQATEMQQYFETVDRSILHLAQPVKVYSTSGSSDE